jgi:hypothetical protein
MYRYNYNMKHDRNQVKVLILFVPSSGFFLIILFFYFNISKNIQTISDINESCSNINILLVIFINALFSYVEVSNSESWSWKCRIWCRKKENVVPNTEILWIKMQKHESVNRVLMKEGKLHLDRNKYIHLMIVRHKIWQVQWRKQCLTGRIVSGNGFDESFRVSPWLK